MDKETAKYIVKYYFHLLSGEEKLAWRHHSSILKLEENNNPTIFEMYKTKGWVTEDKEILSLLEDGYDNFEINAAQKILSNQFENVFINKCPRCEKLARTPYAKQCRCCNFDWRNSNST